MYKNTQPTIITKYLSGAATDEEIKNLLEWIEQPENQSVFNDYVETDVYLNWCFQTFDQQEAFVDFIERREKKVRPKEIQTKENIFKRFTILKYAAVFIGMMALGSLLFFDRVQGEKTIPPDSITLEILNEQIQIVPLDGHKILKNNQGFEVAQTSNGVLSYMDINNNSYKNNGYHILSVPAGKTFQIVLGDGTEIHLNSQSILKYPSNFIGGQSRTVFLEGEAYFKVTKNKSSPFMVNTHSMNTKVYGTEFNVSAYKNDRVTSVVLVEGSVAVNREGFNNKDKHESIFLLPSQKASRSSNSKIAVLDGVDVTYYISWKNGIIMFENETMQGILKKLERRYAVEIDNKYKELNEKRFTGSFDVEGLEHALNTIKAHTDFEYKRNGGKITLHQPKSCAD